MTVDSMPMIIPHDIWVQHASNLKRFYQMGNLPGWPGRWGSVLAVVFSGSHEVQNR